MSMVPDDTRLGNWPVYPGTQALNAGSLSVKANAGQIAALPDKLNRNSPARVGELKLEPNRQRLRDTEPELSALCGRLSVGKGSLSDCIAGRCGHVFGLRCGIVIAAGHNAFRRSDPQSISRTRGAGRKGGGLIWRCRPAFVQ